MDPRRGNPEHRLPGSSNFEVDSRHEDLPALREKLSRFQITNRDLIQELSAASKRIQRLATSLGFNDAFEAQAAIDAADLDLTYHQFTDTIRAQQAEVMMLRKENKVLKQELKIRKLNSFPLDADTTGYLFTFLPDFPSLISMSHSCRFLYNIFKAGHQAIASAVALNQIGPALPQALRLARTEVAGLRQVKVNDLPREDVTLPVGITGRESAILARNAEAVSELENLFSWKRKDRKSMTSVLTEQESFRFQRALYRIMLLCFVHGMGSISEEEMSEEGYGYTDLEKYQFGQKHFLEEYPTFELYEIQRVTFFVRYLASIRRCEDTSFLGMEEVYDFHGLALFAGPCFILQCYKYSNSFYNACKYLHDDGLYADFITIPLRKVLSDRGESKFMDNSTLVLDSIHGMDDPCTKCGSAHLMFSGVYLVNDTCWNDLKGDLRENVGLWSKNLLSNPMESQLRETLRNLDYRIFMDTLFDARSHIHSDWKKDDWICLNCLSSLCIDALHIWWLELKRKAGEKIEKNCRDGVYCQKQSSLEHAQMFNHICPRYYGP